MWCTTINSTQTISEKFDSPELLEFKWITRGSIDYIICIIKSRKIMIYRPILQFIPYHRRAKNMLYWICVHVAVHVHISERNIASETTNKVKAICARMVVQAVDARVCCAGTRKLLCSLCEIDNVQSTVEGSVDMCIRWKWWWRWWYFVSMQAPKTYNM